jgi:hypothetical protein
MLIDYKYLKDTGIKVVPNGFRFDRLSIRRITGPGSIGAN